MPRTPTQLRFDRSFYTGEPELDAASGSRPSGALRTAAFFAGVGGLEMGLEAAGHRTAMLCEYEKGARSILEERFPGVHLEGDVRDVDRLPECDLVTAGFPCQDLSQAGRTAGIGGEQSGLIQKVFWLIEKSREKPEWILLENVPFMLQLERGKGMTYLAGQLARLGYSWAYRVIDAASFGLPQRRKRVVVLASRTQRPEDFLLSKSAKPPKEIPLEDADMCGFYWTEGLRGLGWAVESTPTLKGGSTIGIPSPPAIWDRTSRAKVLIGTPSIKAAERLQGFPVRWTAPAVTSANMREGFRWRLVGNAVSVRLSTWLGEQFLSPSDYDDSEDTPITPGESWPAAAWGRGKKWFRSSASTWAPSRWRRMRLSRFLKDDPLKPLSLRATSGFLDRARRSPLHFPEGFLEAVAEHEARMRDGERDATQAARRH